MKAQDIFLRAIELEPGRARSEFVAWACQGDSRLARGVEELLAAHAAPELAAAEQSALGTTNTFHPQQPVAELSDSSHHGRFLPGTKLAGRYRIVSLLGRGGMGEVYRADDLRLGQSVALKFLPKELASDAGRLEHFHNEVRLARQVSHPNVCRVYDVGDVDGHHFLSMEYIDGEDLKSLLRRIGRLPADKGIAIAGQLCAALASAHAKGVLHRDLKPANIMIDGQGQARITDFGLATAIDGKPTVAGHSGTPAYMAPEQFLKGQTSVQSDLYSLGLVLLELFTGKPGHQASSLADLRRLHEDNSASPAISSLAGQVDPAVESLLARCLHSDPTLRPRSTSELAAGLPGADPLVAALAAGEFPSPELVAASGGKGTLAPRQAVALLAGIVLALAATLLVSRRAYVINALEFPRDPALLVEQAASFLRRFDEREPVDSAYGFESMSDELSSASNVNGASEPVAKPPADLNDSHWPGIRFWYRESPEELLASDFFSSGGAYNFARASMWSPRWTPGTTGITLDHNGLLRTLRAGSYRRHPSPGGRAPSHPLERLV